jgi:hypothetical protein
MTSLIVFGGILLAMIGVSAILLTHSMRKYATQRAESEQRAADAFAEMQRLTKELRERAAADQPAHLKPGEKLQQKYPGVRGPRATVEEGT